MSAKKMRGVPHIPLTSVEGEENMKRLRIGAVILTTIGLLMGSAGKGQAVIGIPDDVPAATLLFPFFKVNPNRTSSNTQDTLIVVTNTANLAVHVHFTVWSITSQHLYDFTAVLTQHDVFPCSVFDLVLGIGCSGFIAPTSVATALQTSLDGVTFLVGYITADVVTEETSLFPSAASATTYPAADCNILLGHQYIVNLPAGSATGFNAVSIERLSVSKGQPTRDFGAPFGFYANQCGGTPCAWDFLERLDGTSGDQVQTDFPDDSPGLSLLFRYFTASALQGKTELWIWKDRNSPTAGLVGLGIYDEDEHRYSISITLPNEVNYININPLIAPGIPGGWFRVKLTNAQFGDPPRPVQAVGYALHTANSANASLRWDAIFPAHRQYTNYRGDPGIE